MARKSASMFSPTNTHDRDHFTLRSLGADAKENTPDDIELAGRN